MKIPFGLLFNYREPAHIRMSARYLHTQSPEDNQRQSCTKLTEVDSSHTHTDSVAQEKSSRYSQKCTQTFSESQHTHKHKAGLSSGRHKGDE